jgi:hypothetical protein
MNELVHTLLEAIIHTCGFEFASIHLVNQKSKMIETKACMRHKNIKNAVDPMDFVGPQYYLDPPPGQKINISALVLKTYENKIFSGWHPNLDREVYDRCNQKI